MQSRSLISVVVRAVLRIRKWNTDRFDKLEWFLFMSIFLSDMQASDRKAENGSKNSKRSNAGHVCMSHAVLKQEEECDAMM